MSCEICKDNFPVKERHHIHSRSLGGSDKKCNICDLCPNCHALVHAGEIVIEGKFGSTEGIILIWRKKEDQSITGLPDPPVFIFKENDNG